MSTLVAFKLAAGMHAAATQRIGAEQAAPLDLRLGVYTRHLHYLTGCPFFLCIANMSSCCLEIFRHHLSTY